RYAGPEQVLGGVDVAHAHNDPLVHQERLHRRAAAAAARIQPVAVEVAGKRLGAQALQQLVHGAGRLPQQAAEAARIGEAQYPARVQADVDVVVRSEEHTSELQSRENLV